MSPQFRAECARALLRLNKDELDKLTKIITGMAENYYDTQLLFTLSQDIAELIESKVQL